MLGCSDSYLFLCTSALGRLSTSISLVLLETLQLHAVAYMSSLNMCTSLTSKQNVPLNILVACIMMFPAKIYSPSSGQPAACPHSSRYAACWAEACHSQQLRAAGLPFIGCPCNDGS